MAAPTAAAPADSAAVCDDSNDPACKEKRKEDGIDEDVAAKREENRKRRDPRKKTHLSRIPYVGKWLDRTG